MAWMFEELTSKIISAAIEVHKHLSPGLLEIAYQTCLADELNNLKIKYQREVVAPLIYKGRKLDCGFRIDFLVENDVVVEWVCCITSVFHREVFSLCQDQR